MPYYYIDTEQHFEGHSRTYTHRTIFNSLNAMNDFKRIFEEKNDSMRDIIASGEAVFNKRGILVPK